MNIEKRIQNIKQKLLTIYKITTEVVEELNSIEREKAWLSLKGFENSTFKVFLESNFDLSYSAFMNMQKLITNYGKKDFDNFGAKVLRMVDKTDNPKKTLAAIKRLKKNNEIVSFNDYKKVINKNRSDFVDKRGRKKGTSKIEKSEKIDEAVWDDPIEWLKEQTQIWVDNQIIIQYQCDLILDYYTMKRSEKKSA